MEERKQFTFYSSFFRAAQSIKKSADRARFYDAVCAYALTGEEIPLPGEIAWMMDMVRPTLDSSRAKANNASRRKRNKQGTNGEQNGNKTETNEEEEKEEDKVKEKEKVKAQMCIPPTPLRGERSNTRFSPPSFDEVAEYCAGRNNGIDPQRFLDHYEANGWMVGKVRMKDWKAAVRTWERSEYGGGTVVNSRAERDLKDEFELVDDGMGGKEWRRKEPLQKCQ